MPRQRLSVLVTTFNEADNLPACLEGVRWADEILVVDSGSRDTTVGIATRAGARVVQHAYESAARQKNWALPQLRHPWVLILDADERVPPALADEIAAVLERDGPCDGYFLRRESTFLGRRIRHCGWDRDRVLRLFRRDRGRYDDRLVHETLQLEGRTGTLRAALAHDTYRSFGDYIERLDRYTQRGAADLRARGARASIWPLLVRPPARFCRMYLLQAGFLDGVHGLLLCTLAACSVWIKYARLFETPVDEPARRAPAPAPAPEEVAR